MTLRVSPPLPARPGRRFALLAARVRRAVSARPPFPGRALAPALALVPALVLVLALAWPAGAPRAATPPFDTWEPEIRRFEQADSATAPPPNPIVFTGSSSIRMWETLAEDFAGITVLNRGFGGSEIADATHFAERIVLKYHPKEVVAAFRAFTARVRGGQPDARIVYIAIKPSPSRWALVDRIRAANAAIRRFCATQPNMAFVDVFTPMLTPAGRPRPEFFRPDSLHMTRAGYELWTSLVRPALAAPRAPVRKR